MAKLSSASIRLVQKLNRVNASGECPIYIIVCYRGRKEKSTGISCRVRDWNAQREEIRKGCPNAPVLNKMLYDIKQRVIERKNEFEYNGKQYTPSMLLDDDIVLDLSANGNLYSNIYKNYLSDMGSSGSTIRLYDYTYNVLKKYFGRNDFLINDITLANIKKMIKSLDLGDNSIRGILGRIAAVWNYAIGKGIVDGQDYPFREWKYSQKFKKDNRTYYIDSSNLVKLRDYFISHCLDISGELFGYKSGIEDRLMKRSSKEFALCFFLMCYRLNGSSPIDVALLKVDNCSRVTVDGIDYWKVEFKRKKTGIPVVCLLKRDIITMVCFEHYLGTAFMRGNYIYPILKSGIEGKQITNSMGKFCSEAVRWLREVSKEINAQTIKDNAEKGLEEPLIDVEDICLYSARHSFANSYLSQPKASVAALASLMARSPNTIATYIHQLKGDREVADAVKDLPI